MKTRRFLLTRITGRWGPPVSLYARLRHRSHHCGQGIIGRRVRRQRELRGLIVVARRRADVAAGAWTYREAVAAAAVSVRTVANATRSLARGPLQASTFQAASSSSCACN